MSSVHRTSATESMQLQGCCSRCAPQLIAHELLEQIKLSVCHMAGLVLKSGITMDTHLVVDASGRHSRLPQWLVDEGFAAPPAETVNSRLGYATRMYHIPNWNKVTRPLLHVVSTVQTVNESALQELWCAQDVDEHFAPETILRHARSRHVGHARTMRRTTRWPSTSRATAAHATA